MLQKDAVSAADDLSEVIHRCMLNEVFLLLDFISGRSDSTLAGLGGMVDPARPDRAMTATEALTALNHIRYPPPDSENDRARDATILIQAKDRLNNLARPATGLSVAYTTMFVGGAFAGDGWGSRVSAAARRSKRLGWLFGSSWAEPATRSTLAAHAFPSLVASALRFRTFVFCIMICALLITVFSVWVSFQVALGRSLMLRFDALDQQKMDISTRIYAAEHEAAPSAGALAPRLCGEHGTAPRTVEQQQLCDTASDWQRKNELAYRDLRNYAGNWGLRALTPAAAAGAGGQKPAGSSTIEDSQSEQLAASVLTAFSTSIMPVLFALLGTSAAVVRGIYRHVRERTLTPRQLNLTLIRLPLGLVAGVSVGLLFSPTVATIQGGSGLAGGLALSASGVAFLAGYGVEAVFSLFDALLKRVFSAGAPDEPTAPRKAADATEPQAAAQP